MANFNGVIPKKQGIMYDAILKSVSKYVDLDAHEVDVCAQYLKPKKLKKRQFLLQTGDVCRHISFINKGCLRTFYIDKRGEERILHFGIEERWTGDLASYISRAPSECLIESLEPCELIQIERDEMEELFLRVPKIEKYYRHVIQNIFIQAQKRIISTIGKTARERYEEFVTTFPNLEQRVPQYMIAGYLGFTPEFMSKIRKEFRKS